MLRLALLLVLGIGLQAVFTSRFTVLGVTADVFLILPVLVGMSRGALVGALFGFISGLVADIVFMDPIGLRMLLYLLAGYLCGLYWSGCPLQCLGGCAPGGCGHVGWAIGVRGIPVHHRQ